MHYLCLPVKETILETLRHVISPNKDINMCIYKGAKLYLLVFTSTQLSKVLCRLWDNVRKQLHLHAANRHIANGNIKENNRSFYLIT